MQSLMKKSPLKIKNFHIKDISLAEDGKNKIEWAHLNMPVLELISKRFFKEKPLKGINIGACLHVTSETANLMITLKNAGAKLALCASNPLSTQDEVAASLVKHHGISVFAIKGEDNKTYYEHIQRVLDFSPHITMDDGADMISTIHKNWNQAREKILGGTEETTTGVIRLRAMEKDNSLKYPVISVNDALTKYMFDNRYGTGQSTMDGILRATNMLIAGKTVVVAGYGWCGRGVAMKARGLGANVIVTEVNELKALEATMDGFVVMPMKEASAIGDLFITLTGNINVIDVCHFQRMKDGAIVCNSGHFNVEINIEGLKSISTKVRHTRPFIEEFTLANKRKIFLLAQGRLINLSAAEGHPASVMDMSFANQALSVEYIAKHGRELDKKVYPVPKEIDLEIAKLKLNSMKITIDKLTAEQKKYLSTWQEGT